MHCTNKKSVFLWIFIISLCCFLNITYADTLKTTLSRDRIALGETVTLSYDLPSGASPDFSPLEKDFRIISTNQSSAINITNGAMRFQRTWQVTLEPKKTGELWIPAINFGNMQSSVVKLIVEDVAQSGPTNKQSTSVFIQSELNNTSPYVKSEILYKLKLFYRTQLENPMIELPNIENATLTQVGSDKHYEASIKGERYVVYEKNFAIFPLKPGQLIIPPFHFRALLFDTNSVFMNDPYALARINQPIRLATQSFKLDVQNIPGNFTDKTWLPAKHISLTETWSSQPTEWRVGDPITRTITVEAQGLRADQIPDFPADNLAGVNTYADPPRRSNDLQGDSVVGRLQQKITYIPNISQSFSTPVIQLNWWDTENKTNNTAQLKSVNVQVKDKPIITDALSKDTGNDSIKESKPLSPASANTLTTQQQRMSTVEPSISFYQSPWFWMALCLFMVWLITLGLWWRISTRKKIPILTPEIAKESTLQWSDKALIQACEQANAILVQKLLLLWAATHWQSPPRNLRQLCEKIDDDAFKAALDSLEQALYASGKGSWNAHELLIAYQKVRKDIVKKEAQQVNSKITSKQRLLDPLPPLYPEV